MATETAFRLTEGDRRVLRGWLRSTSMPAGMATRARLLLDLDDGIGPTEVGERHQVTRQSVHRWKRRYQNGGLNALNDRPRSGRPTVIEADTVKRVLKLTRERVPQESDHWSLSLMARYAQTTIWQVSRIWKAAGLAPHRIKTFKISNDPAFAEKVIDVVGLYMNPPQNAAVFSVDEKTQIQALDRTQPALPEKEDQPETRTHDYRRHGVTNLYAAFDILSGEVIGQLTDRARGAEFLGFLKEVDAQVPAELDLHLIIDNSSTHGTPEVKAWLSDNPRIHLHRTPTSASWLNAVEGWFSRLERRALRRGRFTSVAQLKEAIEHFIKAHNDHSARPFRWTKTAEKIIGSVNRAKQALHD